MSVPGTVRDNMITKLGTLFPNKTRISKPRALDQNNDNLLKDGWGIFIGPTSPSEQDLGFHFSVRTVDINVIVSERIMALDNDITAEATVEESLQDDKDSIIDSFKDILKEGVDGNIVDLNYVGDDGGEFIFGDKNNYLALTINFALSYKQDLTYCV